MLKHALATMKSMNGRLVEARFEQDIANLSIHLRTRKEMSKVDAHWELIEAIKIYVTKLHQIHC